MHCSGGSLVFPSHHTSPSGKRATLVKIVFFDIDAIALGLVCQFVPGTTPKYPASGLMARNRPVCSSTHIQTMSSPTVVIFHPWSPYFSGGISMAKFVLPQELGNAAATYVFSPLGACAPISSMCSAIHPCWYPRKLAMRSARHFLPSSALPPYPEPNDQIVLSRGKWQM